MRLHWLPRLARLLLVPLLLAPLAFAGQTRAAPDESIYLIGAGVYDITGPAAEQGMMGYAMLGQKTAGIHTRLRSRAFAIAEPQAGGRRVVFASVDMGLMPQAVKQNVVARLRARYGALYGDDNVLLSATHTHGGPGGYSHYALYNITTLGFSPQTFEIVTSGIFQSIVRAHDNLAPGTIRLAAGDLPDGNANRSPEAYALNPAAERAAYAHDTDRQMTVLRLQEQGGREAGMISWYPAHATSMTNQNLLITGDNKGYASQLFERLKGTDYQAAETFVAAFAQANEGDVSPCPNSYGGGGCGRYDEFVSTALNGQRQHDKALALYNQPGPPLAGRIDYRHAYLNLAGLAVEPRYGAGAARRTCVAAIGASFAAGAEDGPSNFPWVSEGMKHQGLVVAEDQACHQPKPILLPTGRMQPYPWTPEVLPVQILTVGNLALVAVPGEWTTMAGRRLRAAVAAELAPLGVDHVVIAGLANAYAGYVTTREEYQAQHYEGASTHFGPWTEAAFRQEFARLAAALRAGTPVAPGPAPRDLACCQISLQTGVVFDDVPLGRQFGAIDVDAAASYQRGQTARAVFWGAHPKNNPQIQSTYLKVQRNVQGAWVTVAGDWDAATRYRWARSGVAYSKVTVEWDIPADAPPGSYRIVHDGHWKSGWTGAIKPYAGASRVFAVQP